MFPTVAALEVGVSLGLRQGSQGPGQACPGHPGSKLLPLLAAPYGTMLA